MRKANVLARHSASSRTRRSSTSAPATRSDGAVYSSTLWLIPPTLGTKIMQAGQTAAMTCASCPAPLGRRLTEKPSSPAIASTRSTSLGANATGGKRASASESTWPEMLMPSKLCYLIIGRELKFSSPEAQQSRRPWIEPTALHFPVSVAWAHGIGGLSKPAAKLCAPSPPVRTIKHTLRANALKRPF